MIAAFGPGVQIQMVRLVMVQKKKAIAPKTIMDKVKLVSEHFSNTMAINKS